MKKHTAGRTMIGNGVTSRMARVMCALGVLTIAATAAAQCHPGPVSSQPIAHFESGGRTMVESLLALGREQHVCIGIRDLEEKAITEPLNIHLSSTTVGDVIRKVLGRGNGYDFAEKDGIVLITNARHRIAIFDHVVSTFKCKHSSVQSVSNLLYMQLMLDYDPSITGFAGTYPSGELTDLVGPFDVQGRSVAELLDMIVGQSKGGLWLPARPSTNPPLTPGAARWQIIEYSVSPDSDSAILAAIGKNFRKEDEKGAK